MNRTLPNGNEIVAIDFEAGFVLSTNDNYHTKYVTHSFYRGDLASTSNGHYFTDLDDARDDLLVRIKREY